MTWFDVVASRDHCFMWIKDDNQGEVPEENGCNFSFRIHFHSCEIGNHWLKDFVFLKFLDGMKKHQIEINIIRPASDEIKQKVIIIRKSGASFCITMSQNDFVLFIALLSSNVNYGKLIRFSVENFYHSDSDVGVKQLAVAAQLLNREADHLSYPEDEVRFRLGRFGFLFESQR